MPPDSATDGAAVRPPTNGLGVGGTLKYACASDCCEAVREVELERESDEPPTACWLSAACGGFCSAFLSRSGPATARGDADRFVTLLDTSLGSEQVLTRDSDVSFGIV